MKKYSGHKLKKFLDGHDLRGECVINPCRPPMKGGHTHNHCYNAAYTAAFGRHSLRRIPRDKKTEWVRIWEKHARHITAGALISTLISKFYIRRKHK